MDPLGIVALGMVAYAGMKMSKDKYAVPNPRDRQFVSKKNLVSPSLIMTQKSGPYIGNPLDVTKVPKLEQVTVKKPETYMREYPQSTFQPKQAVQSFFDVAQSKPVNGIPFIAQPNFNEVVPKYNNVNPIGQKINVGPGLGTMAPATGGFQQFFRVYPNLTNEHRLNHLEGGFGTPGANVASGALAPSSSTSGYSSQGGPITSGPTITKDPNRNNTIRYAGGPGGGLGYYQSPIGQYVKSEVSTIKDQTGTLGGLNSFGAPRFQAAPLFDANSGMSGTPKPTNRSQTIDDLVVGGGAYTRADNPDMTSLKNDNNMIPQGPPNGTRFSSITTASGIGSYQSTDIRGQALPDRGTAADNLANNPFAISLA
jgi:Family of unknown function (DUF5899)